MARFARFIDGIRRLFRRTRLEQEFDAELSDFLETSIEEKDPCWADPGAGHSRGANGVGQRRGCERSGP